MQSQSGRSGKTILVVEDDLAIGALLARRLEHEGYRAVQATNGKEALRVLVQTPIDLVITDILMPEKDGLELLGVVRQEHPGIKVITISGPEHQVYLRMSERLGAVRSFCKPLDLTEIMSAVDQFTESSE